MGKSKKRFTENSDTDSLSRYLLNESIIICSEGEPYIPCSRYNSSLLDLFVAIIEKDSNFSWSRKHINYSVIKSDFDKNRYTEKCRNITYILLTILDKVISGTVTNKFAESIIARLKNEYN